MAVTPGDSAEVPQDSAVGTLLKTSFVTGCNRAVGHCSWVRMAVGATCAVGTTLAVTQCSAVLTLAGRKVATPGARVLSPHASPELTRVG